jgi:hypothetical protein
MRGRAGGAAPGTKFAGVTSILGGRVRFVRVCPYGRVIHGAAGAASCRPKIRSAYTCFGAFHCEP